jgi:hypothetical protein
VRLAARGACDLDNGPTAVTNPEHAGVLWAKAARIYAVSLAGALLLTGLGLLLVGM